MTALALRQQDCKWTIMSGPLKGSVQVISQPLIVIGRSSECDIVIVNDPKCSRRHAEVNSTAKGFQIQILSDSNGMWVNGEPQEIAVLKNGDVVTIGDTELQFNIVEPVATKTVAAPSVRKESSIRVAPPASQPIYYAPEDHGHHRTVHGDGRPVKKKSKVKGLGITIAVIGLIFLWLLTGNNAKKKKEITIRTEEQIAQDIEAAKNLADAAEKMRIQNNLSNSYEINHAQENYVKGFRDYRKGQYERALESFQACLALNPEHVLCNRYLRLSQRKFSELIEYHMVLGRQYRDQNQYRACRTSFQNVLTMVRDQSSPKYKEAKANFDACNRFVEGRF